jgi:PPP family 3-phenylpropionic acid transporter
MADAHVDLNATQPTSHVHTRHVDVPHGDEPHVDVPPTIADLQPEDPLNATQPSSHVHARHIDIPHVDLPHVDIPPPAAGAKEDLRARTKSLPLSRLSFLKIAFMSVSFGTVVLGAYGSLLLDEKGFSGATIGWLSAVPPLCNLFVVPIVSYVAETRNLQQPIMIGDFFVSCLSVVIMCTSSNLLLIAIVYCVHYVIFCAVPPLMDEHTMAVLGPARKATWGRYRSWGAYGWAGGAVLGSWIFGNLGWQYMPLWWIVGTLTCAFAVWQMPVVKVAGDHRFLDILRQVASRPQVMLWMVGVACLGVGYALIGTFLCLFLDSLGAPSVLYGLCIVFTVLVEIPLFRRSVWLHATFSNRALLCMAFAAWVTRVFGYSVLVNPWFVLLLEPIHGVTFGFMWLSGIHFFTGSFPAQLSNSAIGLLHASAFGVGPIIGNIVGGYMYDGMGPRMMFRVSAAAMCVVAFVFYYADRRLDVATAIAAANAAAVPTESIEMGASAMAVETPRHPDAAVALDLAATFVGVPHSSFAI